MFFDCDTVDDDEAEAAAIAAAAGVRCATGWVGRHRSMEVVVPRSLTDAGQGYQGPSDERRNSRDPTNAQRSRPGSINFEGLWLENQFRSKRRPMSEEAASSPLNIGPAVSTPRPSVTTTRSGTLSSAASTTGGFSCARRTDGNGASRSLAG